MSVEIITDGERRTEKEVKRDGEESASLARCIMACVDAGASEYFVRFRANAQGLAPRSLSFFYARGPGTESDKRAAE